LERLTQTANQLWQTANQPMEDIRAAWQKVGTKFLPVTFLLRINPVFGVDCFPKIPARRFSMSAKPIPDGYHSITPALTVRDAERAIEFYKQAFGATQRGVMKGPDGKVMHAELQIGDSILMLSDEFPEFGALSPQSAGGSSTLLHIYVDGVDAAFDRAVKAGAEVEMPVMDQFWGDRYGKLKDPFGHKWSIATHMKDLSMDEMKQGMDEAMQNMQRPHQEDTAA
jgi:PhnB protein